MDDARSLTMPDGRTVGYADFGPVTGVPVIDCHGGPGNRLSPARLAGQAAEAGFRIVGIDRPGYGLSTPRLGRSIAGWVPDALAVADALGIDRFVTVGTSTGASYAMALAAEVPDRIIAAIACCGITDMRWQEGRDLVTADGGQFARLWGAPDRDAAIAAAIDFWGDDGSKVASQPSDAAPLPPADVALFADPAYLTEMVEGLRHSFTFGVQGYADDRIADGAGWGSFDVTAIRCPVVVLHGADDSIAPVAFAEHTASIVPGAELRVVPGLGHFSIGREIVPALCTLLDPAAGR